MVTVVAVEEVMFAAKKDMSLVVLALVLTLAPLLLPKPREKPEPAKHTSNPYLERSAKPPPSVPMGPYVTTTVVPVAVTEATRGPENTTSVWLYLHTSRRAHESFSLYF